MARLSNIELSAIRWLLGQALVLISFAGSYTIDLGAAILTTAGLAMVLLSCLLPQMIERLPALIWKIAPVFLLTAIVADFILSKGDVLSPLFRMVVLLTLFRSLQIRSPREDLQLLLLTLFLLIITGVLSQEIVFGLQMLIYAPIAMGQLFVVNLSAREPGNTDAGTEDRVFRGFNWIKLIRHVRERMDYGTLISGMLLFMFMTVLALLLFVLMPRFDIGAALPFPRLQTSTSLSGFSDKIEYGDVVNILEDDSIAMRVDVELDNPVARPYWRMVVLDAYYAGGFMVSPRVVKDFQKVQHYIFNFQYPRSFTLDDSVWTLYLEGGISSYLPAGDVFRSFQFKNRTEIQIHDLTRVFQATEINANTLSIRYQGLRFDGIIPFGPDDEPLLNLKPSFRDTKTPAYLKEVRFPETLLVLPDGNPNRRILSDLITRVGYRPSMTMDQFIARAIELLQRGRGYSLQSEIPDGEADRILRWVASGQPGHCELYAGAFVLMARAAGFPARLVTGFVGGDWNGFENYFMVRNRNAHAWCEILDPSRGWIRVDPTPGYDRGSGSVDEALSNGYLSMDRTLKAYLDSLRILWYRRVIQFDGEDQLQMAEFVKDTGLFGVAWLKQRFNWVQDQFNRDWSVMVERGQWIPFLRGLAGPLLLLVALVVLPVLIWRRIRQKGFEEIIRNRAGKALQFRKSRGYPEEGQAVEELHRIRYGPVSIWPNNPQRVIARLQRSRDIG